MFLGCLAKAHFDARGFQRFHSFSVQKAANSKEQNQRESLPLIDYHSLETLTVIQLENFPLPLMGKLWNSLFDFVDKNLAGEANKTRRHLN